MVSHSLLIVLISKLYFKVIYAISFYIIVPPETSPEIEAGLTDSGDNVTVICSTPRSKPAANISWHLNEGMVSIVRMFFMSRIPRKIFSVFKAIF